MKYMLLVHHDEEAFGKFSETKRQQMLAESVQLTHKLHADGKYLSASPLHQASTAAIVRGRDGKRVATRRSASRLGFPGRASELSKSGRSRRSRAYPLISRRWAD